MRVLDRKLLRDLWRIRGVAVAIALVVGAGVATFVMALGTRASLEQTRDAYYERYRFADVFAGVKRAPEQLARRIARLPGVIAVETRIVENVTLDIAGLDEPAVGRLVSIPETDRPLLNDLKVQRGRRVAPGRPDEAVISEAFAEVHGFTPGDRLTAIINGHKRRLEIVGIALSPEYVYSIAPGAVLPDDTRFGILWMGREALAAAFDLDGAFNDVSLALLPGASADEVIDRLDDLLERYGGVGAYQREDQLSNWFLNGEIEQLGTMASIMPTIFLAVSAFLLNMVVSRLVATEREQIGLLKAFGYSNAAVGWHYFKLTLAMVSLGLLVGALGGAWLGRELTESYAQIYRFPFLFYRLDPSVYGGAALVGALAAVIGASSAVHRAVTLPPAQAMAPPAPPTYRRGVLERLRLAAFLDQPTLMIFRHLGRWPVRTALTATGIAFAVALLVTSLHWLDAIDHMLDVEFNQVRRQDVSVALVDARSRRALDELTHLPGVLAAEPYRVVAVRLRAGHRERREAITGVEPGADLNVVLDVDGAVVGVPPDGLMMSTKLADLLGVGPGDVVTVEAMEGRRPVRDIPVVGVFETYLGTPVYMDLGALNRLMYEGPSISGAHLLVDARSEAALYRELKDIPSVAAVSLRTASIESFRETLAETINFIIFFYILFGAVLTFGVVYNSARISLSERGRELASMRVLGFSRSEVSYIMLGELAVLTFVALAPGCLLGYGLAWFITEVALETELYRVPLVVARATYGIAVATVTVAAIVSTALVRRRIDRLDLVAVLKTRE